VKVVKRLLIIFFIILACVGCDQSTKLLATKTLANKPTASFFGDTFRLQYTENTGSFLGLGGNLPNKQRFLFFTVMVTLILLGLFAYTLVNKKLDITKIFTFSIILGGGISNLYDRIVNEGAVVDFMNMGIGQLRTGIFNVADVLIMVGVFVLLIHSIKKENYEKNDL